MGSKPKRNLGQVWAMSILSQANVRYSPGSYILQILKGCAQDVLETHFPLKKFKTHFEDI